MDIETAKSEIAAGLKSLGYANVDIQPLSIKAARIGREAAIIAVNEDCIKSYLETAAKRSREKTCELETALIYDDVYEQLLESSNEGRSVAGYRGSSYTFSNDVAGGLQVTIGEPSDEFICKFMLNKSAISSLTDRLDRLMPNYERNISTVFSRVTTIRISGASSLTNNCDIERLTGIANDCLFELSYLKGRNYELRNLWSQNLLRERMFRLVRTMPGSKMPLKGIHYDEAITRFYKRAVATTDTYVQFISFYHVLEYFFVSVSDDLLYQKIKNVTADPSFMSKRKNIERIIKSVEDHGKITDETEMLKNVLSKYVSDVDIIEFIEAFEQKKGRLYTEKNEFFGQIFEKMTLKEGHIIGPVSKRIKSIRNFLIHSSDRHDRTERYIPSGEANRLLRREIPMLRFLAERVIIASAITD